MLSLAACATGAARTRVQTAPSAGFGAVRMIPPGPIGDDPVFHVCCQFESGARAVLPASGRRFVLEEARVPAGISARRGRW